MDRKNDSRRRGGRPPIDEDAKRVYLTALGRGATKAEAAKRAGFSRSAFARLCRDDPDFDAMREDALERSTGPRFICPGKGRAIQIRRNRRVYFTEERREIFLDRFAGTCNLAEAAEAAGVAESTVFAHLAKDPDFAARFRAVLPIGYVRLEADVVQRRIEAQKRLKAIEPTGEPEPEFDRAMKLLQRWDRKDGTIGPRGVRHGHMERWDFDEAMKLLAARLKALGFKPTLPPPDQDSPGEGDSPREGEEGEGRA
jgi:hypothetical protein